MSKLPLPEIAIVAVAVLLRVWAIELKPPHFDEGINGWFADQMTATGYYRYDPTNYHGPLHFYAVFVSQTLFGRHLWALRLPAIIAGVLCVWALLRTREFFGPAVARMAALAAAVSPAFVFYSRYSIHESWQVLFSILFCTGLLGLWKSGARRYFFTAIFSAAGLILTKETYVIHIGGFALAALVLALWQRVVPSRPGQPVARQEWTCGDAAGGIGGALLLIVFFYSGTFRDFGALAGLYETFGAWFRTGVEADGHAKTSCDIIGPLNYYWVALMARYEWPALAGLLACARFIFPSDARYRYLAIMGGGTLLAYSLIPYKTPWCIISMIWPFYLIFAGVLEEWRARTGRSLVRFGIAALLLAESLAVSLRLNFKKFTDETEAYVYVQTYEDIATLTGPILQLAKNDPGNYAMRGLILLESCYPLPWILGDFTHVGYHGESSPPSDWDADFIVVESGREAEVEANLRRPFYKRRFRLRDSQSGCAVYFSAAKFGVLLGGNPEVVPSKDR